MAIPDTGKVSLKELVSLFVRKDELDKDNLWLCPACGRKVCATSETVIAEAPRILVVHFKRFGMDGGLIKKVTTTVEYPDRLEMVEISKSGEGTYKLLGVVMHSGGMASGHYTASAIDPLSGKWYLFNDAYVSTASEQNVHSTRAYMLFYQRMD
jgi:ubiquitin carboxyl-terminal hydrolase 4/11/15